MAAETLERRVLLSGQTIAGSLWNDVDTDGIRDAGELPLAGRTVYIDADNDGRLGATERSMVTDSAGGYAFGGMGAGTYVVRQVLLEGWGVSNPAAATAGVLVGMTGVRDLVLDESRGLLYVTTDRGVVERIDLASGTKLTGYTVGALLSGADITPDGNALYVADGQAAGAQGVIHKINLTNGGLSSVRYTRDWGESGAYDVAIGVNGKGLVTTRYDGSGWTPLRSLDTTTDTLTARTGVHSSVRQDTQIHRSGDGSTFLLTESNISSGPAFVYDVAADSFTRSAELQTFLGGIRSALNRDGSLIAMEIGGLAIADRDLKAIENLGRITAGFVFDPTKDVLYGVDASDASNDWVVAFDTHAWKELYRFHVGENVTHGGAFGGGALRVTADGRRLVLATPSGVRIFDLVARSGGRTATLTASAGTEGVDFGDFAVEPPEVRISDATVVEGDSDTKSVLLTVTLSAANYQPVRLTYATADGSAAAGDGDFLAASGTLTFAPGETSKTIAVTVRGDAKDELDERFLVNLMGATGAIIAGGQGVVTIGNDDAGLRGSIGGTLWDDQDGDGVREAGEAPLAGRTIYVDANKNGRLDDGEPMAVTGADGRYELTVLPAGEYTVAQVLPAGSRQTAGLGLTGVAGQTFFLPKGTSANPLYEYRDLVYDAARHQLLITTAAGTIERLDLAAMRLLDPLKVGNLLLGSDIAADGSFLYVAEAARNITQGYVRKVSLADGSVTNLAYDLRSLESGAYDVAITAHGRALVTTLFAGSGSTPLRELELATGRYGIRNPSYYDISQSTDLYRSADRSRALLLEGNISSGPVHTYDAATDRFPGHTQTARFVTNFPAAVSRDGSIFAIGFDGFALYDVNLQPLPAPVVSGRTTGLAFDPTRDVLYRATETEITAYETGGFSELFRFPIGETLGGKSPMAVSGDGRMLFLGTGTGVRVYRLGVDGRRVTLAAGQSATGVDFLANATSATVAPTALPDDFAAGEDAAVTGSVLLNDSDADGGTLTVTATDGSSAAVGTTITLASGALLTVNADGTFSYDPNGKFEGLGVGETVTETFTYSVSDGQGGAATATVTVTIAGANDGPAAGSDSATVPEDGQAAGNLLANDSDPDGDPLTVTAVNGSAAAVGATVTLASGAKLTVNAGGTFSYDTNGKFEGLGLFETATETFTYEVSDGQGGTATATVTMTITGANDAPAARPDAATVSERGSATGNVLSNDSDPDRDRLTVSAVNGSASVWTTITLASGAKLRLSVDGTYAYDPNGKFARLRRGEMATDSFSYTVSDGRGGSATATVVVTVAGGADDLFGYHAGTWQVASSTGSAFDSRVWTAWQNHAWDSLLQGDFDGDGRTDVFGLLDGLWQVGLARGAGAAGHFATGLWGSWANHDWKNVTIGDLNGDGKDDIIARLGGAWHAGLSTGTAFAAPTLWAAWHEAPWRGVALVDLNGDGADDLLANSVGQWHAGLSTGNGLVTRALWSPWADLAWEKLGTADFDGDGKADAYGLYRGTWQVGLSTVSGFATSLFSRWLDLDWKDPVVGDFDGDGKADVAARYKGLWQVTLATGATSVWESWPDEDWKDVRVGDFDGDGRDDLVARRPGGNLRVAISTGSAFVSAGWGRWADVPWRAVAAADAGPAAVAVPAGSASASPRVASVSPAPAVPAAAAQLVADEEPLAAFWRTTDEDETFTERLAAV